jgi:Holliday junction resolvasome RuvABC endonuclease subunit
MIRFASIDPSMANLALVVGTIDDNMKIECTNGYLISTEKTKSKQVRASSDTIDRCRELLAGLRAPLQEWAPDVIFVETPSGSQSAAGMKSYGIVCMLIASLDPWPIEVTPQEVKKKVMGRLTASKREIIDWAHARHPDLPWIKGRGKLADKNEHMADAVAIAYTGITTRDFQLVKRKA